MWTEKHILPSKDTVFVATWSCDVIRQVFFTPPGKNDEESNLNSAEYKLSPLGTKIKYILKRDTDCHNYDLLNSFQHKKKELLLVLYS